MVKVKVKAVVAADPDNNISKEPLIVNFEHGQVNPLLVKRVNKVNMCATVFESTQKAPVAIGNYN